MNQKQIAASLNEFSTPQLERELERRKHVRRGKILGYRATLYGDECTFGSYADYLIGKGPSKEYKEKCKQMAENCLIEYAKHGGSVDPIYKDTPTPKKIR